LDLEEFASSSEKKSDRKFGPQTTVQEDVADVTFGDEKKRLVESAF